MIDDDGVLWMLDAKDISAAASNLERVKGSLAKEKSNLLEHAFSVAKSTTETSGRTIKWS